MSLVLLPERFLRRGEDAARRLPALAVDEDAAGDIRNIAEGAFAPLKGFLSGTDYRRVVDHMRLDSGAPWTIPISLDVPESRRRELARRSKILLESATGVPLAVLEVEDIYKVRPARDIPAVYGTGDLRHPGAAKESRRSLYRIGGAVTAFAGGGARAGRADLTVNDARRRIFKSGWRTVVGFQTRNAPHRAHEYLQRTALELHDSLFIHPLVGWKKADDLTPRAVIESYETLIRRFYPQERVLFGVLRTAMRYAGPREAVFHALIRKNYGCTHFIIGRDHAGVGGFYGRYAAHELSRSFSGLGIEILRMSGPHYCRRCGQIVTERTCPHGAGAALEVSGTQVRGMLNRGRRPPEKYMRKEIADVLLRLSRTGQAFCGERR
ncbi:MAG: sulfate adenylyltransferase [Elusimicrobia bacterium]|nr:sulfate adenylyltransferase [Elusimicrobiota bacterium]